LNLVEKMRLREKVRALGGEFEIFLHTPGPDGNARKIEYLRPTIEETRDIPLEIVEISKVYLKVESLWYTEGELNKQILDEEDEFPYAYEFPELLWLFIKNNFDVSSNFATLEPWWKLGNLKRDPVDKVFQNFEENKIPGLYTIYNISPKELVKTFCDPKSTLIYTNKDDLLALCLGKFLEKKTEEAGKKFGRFLDVVA